MSNENVLDFFLRVRKYKKGELSKVPFPHKAANYQIYSKIYLFLFQL